MFIRMRAKWGRETLRTETATGPDSHAQTTRAHGLSLGPIHPAVKVWTLTGLLALVAAGIYFSALQHVPSPPNGWIPWLVFAVAFALAELKVVDVHFRRETHSFSLSEFPAVIGFFLLSPTDYLLAVFVGAGLALLVQRRQRLIKTVFNLANFVCIAAVSLLIVNSLARIDGVPGPQEWAIAFVATSVATVIGAE